MRRADHASPSQNIRNNKTNRRTPKWAQRYGLVDTSELKRKEHKSQWASRYSERNPHSTLEGQQYEDGQLPGAGPDDHGGPRRERERAAADGELWNPTEEQFYGAGNNDSGSTTTGAGRWHYPINADDALPAPDTPRSGGGGKKKKEKKDRWARTEDAYASRDDGARKKKKKRRDTDERSTRSAASTGFPEDAEGGLYGEPHRPSPVRDDSGASAPAAGGSARAGGDEFNHQF